MRKMIGGWAFYDLRIKIEYKAKQAGVPVVFVDPAYTSKTCSFCGSIGSRRKHKFVCKSCGNLMDADHNGAVNISHRGRESLRSRNAVNRPEAAVLYARHTKIWISQGVDWISTASGSERSLRQRPLATARGTDSSPQSRS
ncbi:MAG TPA: transposase, partial [Blastocatellia bacterium]|nr:transposase [Blastocatellia bacterium]